MFHPIKDQTPEIDPDAILFCFIDTVPFDLSDLILQQLFYTSRNFRDKFFPWQFYRRVFILYWIVYPVFPFAALLLLMVTQPFSPDTSDLIFGVLGTTVTLHLFDAG